MRVVVEGSSPRADVECHYSESYRVVVATRMDNPFDVAFVIGFGIALLVPAVGVGVEQHHVIATGCLDGHLNKGDMG